MDARPRTIVSPRVAALALAAALAAACTGASGGGGSGGGPGDGARARRGDGEASAGPVMPSPTPIPRITAPPADWRAASCSLDVELVRRIRRGYMPGRSPDVMFAAREPDNFPSNHAGPWDYLQRVPLVFYGPGHVRARGDVELGREATVADLAPTLAELLATPWPPDRAGRAVTEALVPDDRRAAPPRLVLTIVWDGGGWSGLETWPDAWPNLRRVMDRGTSVTNAIAGSSPSVTPPIHASIGTGTFPKQHGIVDIPVRDGDDVVSSYEGRSPKYIAVPALADLYDAATGNASEVVMFGYKTWHLGMIGHGAYSPGGDKDVAAIVEEDASVVTNPAYYSLPDYLVDFPGLERQIRAVDAADGRRDGRWLGGADLTEVESQRASPVWSIRQTAMLKEIVRREGLGDDDVPDLVFTNYKHIDAVGHDFGLLEPEMEDIIRYSDEQLGELVRFLDREVGRGQWVLALTADHGPAPDLPSKQGFPIHMQRLRAHTAAHFGLEADELIQDERSTGFWLDRDVMAANDITPEDVANFLVRYTIDDNRDPSKELSDVFAERRDEPIFEAAFPGAAMGKVWHCVRKGAG